MYNYEGKCKEVAARFNLVFDTPCSINNRLSSTLGRVKFKSDTLEPIAVEFSKNIFSHTDEEIEQIVLHEMAHWLVLKITKERHGHDEVFKRYCHLIGCTNDGAIDKEYTNRPGEFKYDMICENCGYIGGRSRVLKKIHLYSCATCGGSLRLKQNW